MWRRVCALVVLAGCWSDDPLVNGFTAAQWQALQNDLRVPAIDRCKLPAESPGEPRCDQLAAFGKALFFDPALSGNGMVSCGTCHDEAKYFIDTRPQNNVSLGVPVMGVQKWTKRNAMATVDVALKYQLETTKAFIWSGKARTPGAVLEVAISGPPFETMKGSVANVIRNKYMAQYEALFPSLMPSDDEIIGDIETALDAYMFRITSLDAPFDRWLAGSDGAISDSAKRGFEVFVGRGTCITCHSGPAFSDFDYHDTGVPETGANVPVADLGRADVTKADADNGKFMTPTLRNLARTGPYMHNGAFGSLPEVVDFYRRGGGDGMYSGVKDPRIAPLDLTDDDVQDLVNFLESLNGATLSEDGMGAGSGSGSGSGAVCGNPALTECATGCTNLLVDFNHCGSCGMACMPGMACEMGTCIAAGTCPMPLAPCGQSCVDLVNDRMNCGGCGNVCATYCMNGLCGS